MANKKLTKMDKENLNAFVQGYCEDKKVESTLKKRLAEYNEHIKGILLPAGLTDWEYGNNAIHITIKHSETMNEAKVLELLTKECHDKCVELGIIKTKEYVDAQALEAAIYRGDIPKKTLLKMDACKDIKDTPTLNVVKKKEV